MSLVDYHGALATRERALAHQRKHSGLVRTAEDWERFERSPFMQKCREHELMCKKMQQERDSRRRATDPEFQPRDDDFDRAPVKQFAKDADYYTILGISEEASRAELRKAYRKLCLRYHPDKVKQKRYSVSKADATQTFVRIQEAFEILNDQATRRQYDRARDAEKAYARQYGWDLEKQARKQWRPPNYNRDAQVRRSAGVKEPKRAGDGAATSWAAKKTAPREIPLYVTLDDVARGGRRTVEVTSRSHGSAGTTVKHAIDLRRGELSGKKWVLKGADDATAAADGTATARGDLIITLRVAPHERGLARRGVDLVTERVILVPYSSGADEESAHAHDNGERFGANFETVLGTVVAITGRRPDKLCDACWAAGRRAVLTVIIPGEGLPYLEAPHRRGALSVKFAFLPPPEAAAELERDERESSQKLQH